MNALAVRGEDLRLPDRSIQRAVNIGVLVLRHSAVFQADPASGREANASGRVGTESPIRPVAHLAVGSDGGNRPAHVSYVDGAVRRNGFIDRFTHA